MLILVTKLENIREKEPSLEMECFYGRLEYYQGFLSGKEESGYLITCELEYLKIPFIICTTKQTSTVVMMRKFPGATVLKGSTLC